MVSFRQSNGQKAIDPEWHEFRVEARETAFSLAEFSPQEITRYDLDTARITGRENSRTYTVSRPVDELGEGSADIRELPDR